MVGVNMQQDGEGSKSAFILYPRPLQDDFSHIVLNYFNRNQIKFHNISFKVFLWDMQI